MHTEKPNRIASALAALEGVAEIDALFPEIRRVDVEVLGFEHQLDALRDGAVVFDQKYAHVQSPA